MIAYRVLAHNFQKRSGITFEASLAAISFLIKAIAHQMTSEEAGVFKKALPLELRQLVGEGRARGAHNAKQLIELVADQFDIAPLAAKGRTVGLIEELRSSISPWDEVEFAELLDRMRSELESIELPAAAA